MGLPIALAVSGALLASCVPVTPAARQADEPGVSLATTELAATVVRDSGGGTRGPVLGVLPDGRAVLGGGADGRRLYLYTQSSGQLREIGSVITASQRRDDARFAPTDIEVMSVAGGQANLFVSFPELVAARDCVRLAVDRVVVDLNAATLVGQDRVFRSQPCVSTAGVQQAGGRIVRISDTTAYVSVGDLSSATIAERRSRGQLGTVQRIGVGIKPVRISQGHRNPQGLALDAAGRLWETEHGPRGGDELNLIRRGRDYGWPFVTLGQPYGGSDYVMPRRTGTHSGYTKPRTAWVPSVATSELVSVPESWAGWSGTAGPDLLMGTLKDQALYRIRTDGRARVTQTQRISVGERVRDLDRAPDASVLATTDSGQLLVVRAG